MLFKVDWQNKEIDMDKDFIKKAQIPDSKEYKILKTTCALLFNIEIEKFEDLMK